MAGKAPTTALGIAMADAAVNALQHEQAKTLTPVNLPFILGAFKMNGKVKDYPNEDGSVTRKLATATVTLGESAITFGVSIYQTVRTVVIDGANKVRRETYCSLPSTGKGFPRPVFETDDPRTERAITDWRVSTAAAYREWATKINAGSPDAAGRKHGEDRIVEIDAE